MMYPDIFKKNFIDIFEILTTDKVVNVRISLAQTISLHLKQSGWSFSLYHILITFRFN